MWSPSTKPFESFAVRWQQRLRTAAGRPSEVLHRTMSSPSSVNACGPASRRSIGITAYQKRRSTGCRVTSMGPSSRSGHDPEVLDELRRVRLLPVGDRLDLPAGDHQVVG